MSGKAIEDSLHKRARFISHQIPFLGGRQKEPTHPLLEVRVEFLRPLRRSYPRGLRPGGVRSEAEGIAVLAGLQPGPEDVCA